LRDATIAAIATARGEAALSIVRMSGPRAISIAASVYSGPAGDLSRAPSQSASFGVVQDANGRAVDQVVATVFRAPRSSTGEDVVEFTCHGGDVAPAEVLRALLEGGATPAEPGEFTQKAFLNGKIDLEQAEAVIDLIHSRSVAAHRVSLGQLQGRLKERLGELRSELLELCGLIELELDFIEEDVEFADRERKARILSDVQVLVVSLLESAAYTKSIREGLSVVIAGLPNAGKSTLLNALAGRDRVIVSDVPGTTRDYVDVDVWLGEVLLRVTDTAGLRAASGLVEKEGVTRSEERIQEADVLIYVFDVTAGLSGTEREYLAALSEARPSLPLVLVANKSDLMGAEIPPGTAVSLSARKARQDPQLLEALLEEIRRVLPPGLLDYEASAGMINARQAGHLRAASAALVSARRCMEDGLGGELLAMDLRQALHSIGCITGDITNEDVLAEIFGRFCIGK
jgi:tRNA modification GTPase